ncbi:MarR family transcriptional regulator [Diaminobutyricibacter tongyongensis]|uniref:MarR family transcriptional regulator n=1 Tax=Leifsonia tongyongensis TaxID=1268043 RepID=A0A6L9XTF4_9MICO|nr:MarR family transcriptional regulator [Diaminobutyricibacter tongyongensis]NEN04692.1 MarR family transcriptional regulator [Diaminobutyricibacter tongyongensis]
MTKPTDEQVTAAPAAGFPTEATEATLRASRALLGIVARSVADALDVVTLPQFRVLVVLAGAGPLRMGVLAARVGAVPSTFSRTIDRMADSGWVQRKESPESRREILIDLTALGAQLVADVTERRRRQMAAILSSLNGDQQRTIIHALELFSTAAGEPAPEDLLTLGL